MAQPELKVKVIKLDVDENTAEACLRIVESYVNNHSNVEIIGERLKNGLKTYRFCKMTREVAEQALKEREKNG